MVEQVVQQQIDTAQSSDQTSNQAGQEQGQHQAKKEGLTWLEKVNELQQIPENIRNICILAHVDHGKTTLSDCLIAPSNIISQRMAGQLRYLDSREDEQLRQITMKASSISVIHTQKEPPAVKGGEPTDKNFLVNFIDSPGHVDFSIEVSSAVSLSDGALVMIDVIEGVSPQTTTVIRQAWEAKVKTCLVLNKLDRLIVDKMYDAKQIYDWINQIIENANSYVSELIQGDFIARQENRDRRDRRFSSSHSSGSEKMTDAELDAAEQEFLYSPEKGNVAFCSALDNWGFTLDSMCPRIAKQFGMNAKVLKKFMWGKYYYISSTKKIVKEPPRDDSCEMFVQFGLKPLVAEYRKIFTEEMLQNAQAIRDGHKQIKTKMFQLFPIHKSVLGMVSRLLPSPLEGQVKKIDSLSIDFKNKTRTFLSCRKAVMECNRVEPIIVYVTKMQPFAARIYNAVTRTNDQSASTQKLVAISRVYSGTLKQGSKVFVFGANHTHEKPDVTEVEIPFLFLLMGQSLEPVTQVGPGAIVGIGGLDNILLKTGTISSTLECPNFSKLYGLSKGLIKVTIEPKLLAQTQELLQGLKQMARADPSVEFHINKQGENILSTCGEVHLEKCLKDLETDYAPGIEFEIGEPIIPFKETILNRATRDKHQKVQVVYEELNSSSESSEEEDNDNAGALGGQESMTMVEFLEKQEEHKRAREMVRQEQVADPYVEKLFLQKLYRGDQAALNKLGLKKNCAEDLTANQKCKIKIKAVGLNYLEITKWLEDQEQKNAIDKISKIVLLENPVIEEVDVAEIRKFIGEFRRKMNETKTDKALIRMINDSLVGFGPNTTGSNLLLNKYIKKEQSLFFRIEKLLDLQLKRNLQESNLPTGAINLAPTDQAEESKGEKSQKQNRENDEKVRQEKVAEICSTFNIMPAEIFNGFVNGFNQATQAGPLCEEPMQGACFIVQNIELVKEEATAEEQKTDDATATAQPIFQDTFGSMSGQIISIVKDLCRKSFLNAQPRVAEGMYLCSLVANPENYGIVYNLLNKCRGYVISEECQDGTNYFLLECLIPLVTSFEFHKSVRRECQGMTYPQLVFNGFLINENDPFFIPTTEEDLMEYGVGDILPENPAKILIEAVRQRKGLMIDKKLVIDADKQRTHKRNK